MISLGDEMSEITIATYNFLDALDNSNLIKELTIYKEKLLKKKNLLQAVEEAKKEKNNNILLTKRKAIYEDNDYMMYMKYYNELSLIVLKINKQFKKYTNTRTHNC